MAPRSCWEKAIFSRIGNVAVTLGLACQVSVALAGNGDDPRLQALLQKGLGKGYPGIAMLVGEPDGTILSAAAGFADIENSKPLSIGDGFHLASVNKTFTSVSILKLVDQGRLSTGATVKSVLGDAVARIPNSDRITIAQLLDHSSGIYATNNDPAYLATIIGTKADPCFVWSPQALVALADKDREKPAGEPGSGHI